MWPLLWAGMRTYAPYITFPVALVVGAVGYHLEGLARGRPAVGAGPEKSVLEQRDERRLEEQAGQDGTHVPSLKDRLEFRPRAALDRNRPHQT